jgi:hypothetical protein
MQDVSLLTAMNVEIIVFCNVMTCRLIYNIYMYTYVSKAHSEGEYRSNPATEIKVGY